MIIIIILILVLLNQLEKHHYQIERLHSTCQMENQKYIIQIEKYIHKLEEKQNKTHSIEETERPVIEKHLFMDLYNI